VRLDARGGEQEEQDQRAAHPAMLPEDGGRRLGSDIACRGAAPR
jgi:hypothetical protein